MITEPEVTLRSSPNGSTVGTARLGNRLPARPEGRCDGGRWYQVSGGAYLCSAGARIEPASGELAPLSSKIAARRPALEKATPYTFVKVSKKYSPRYARLPTEAELAALPEDRAHHRAPEGLLERWMNGTYLIAVAGKVEVGGHELLRTVANRYVLAADAEPKPTIEMHGERIEGQVELPLAFTTRDTPLYCGGAAAPRRCGKAEKHARFRATGEARWGEMDVVTGPNGIAAPADAVRVARAIDRPDAIPEGAKWIHIDLSRQTLVAYEGDEPAYATLISSGKRGHDTVTGTFQVERKYVTKTMRGRDENGLYEVQEVPWTMYFTGNFAVHGAYWHDNFGNTRSHGCVNVPPADARWLFHWSKEKLPPGWHSRVGLHGTYVHVSGKTPPTVEEDEAG